jgi:two-component system, OmpR family, response regulator
MEVRRVLLVDDDPSIRRIGELSLQRVAKWQVILAESGTQAIKLALEQQPDVILLDVMMPGMDGPTTLKKLQQNGRKIPVIFMTAKVLKQEIEYYQSLGSIGVIPKPFNPMVLGSLIESILSSHGCGNPTEGPKANHYVS